MGSETNASSVEDATASGNPAGAAAVETERSRRALLKGLGVAAAGAVVGGVLSPKEAQAHHGTLNAHSDADSPAIHGTNSDGGAGVIGDSNSGQGVRGTSTSGAGVFGFGFAGVVGESSSGNGVVGNANSGIGVEGRSFTSGTGVEGSSTSGIGVEGLSDTGAGVRGHSNSGIGVEGRSDTGVAVDGFSERLIGVNGSSNIGIGVAGFSNSGVGVDANGGSVGVNAFGGNIGVIGGSDSGGTGVLARNFGDGLALNVDGPAKFSTAGSGSISMGQDSAFVSNSAVTNESHITATLMGTPGPVVSGFPAVVQWVERQPGVGFVVHMTRRVGQTTPFTYLIIEPA